MFVYREGKQEPPAFFVPYHKMNANAGYLSHYGNFMYLRFIRDNPKSTPAEKRQAIREIAICERKLNWWLRHPNLEPAVISAGKARLHNLWRNRG